MNEKDKKKSPVIAEGLDYKGLPSGRVTFDDLGNAVWEWASPRPQNSVEAGVAPQRRESPPVKRKHAAPSPPKKIPKQPKAILANPLGVTHGYDPYASGKLDRKVASKPKDLRKLGQWLASQKQAKQQKEEE